MLKRYTILTIIILQLLTASLYAGDKTNYLLSDGAYASLITCGPGNEFYSVFGHTSIRICDSAQNIDEVYNYGSFDFGEKGFYLKFARGMLPYYVERMPFLYFQFEYIFDGRAMWEQRLNLTRDELDQLLIALETNILPQNCKYKYDFFRDNCATRVHNMIETLVHGRMPIDRVSYPTTKNTYRSLVYKYTADYWLWWRLGIDMLLGARCDVELRTHEYLFSPMEMMVQYDTARTADSKAAIAQDQIQLLRESRPMPHKSLSPDLVLWILCALVLVVTALENCSIGRQQWLDTSLFSIAAFISLLLLVMCVCSDHYCTKWNLNLLWANPVFLWLAVRFRHKNNTATMIALAIVSIFLISWPMLPQHFNSAVFPIALMLTIRLTNKLRYNKITHNEIHDNTDSIDDAGIGKHGGIRQTKH